MNHNEYISQLEIIFKNLNDNLDRITNEVSQKNEKIIFELSSNKENNLDDIQKLEKQYFKNEEDNNQKISQLKSVILHLEDELQKALNDYNNTHNSILDKENILSKKDSVLSETISAHRKSISELKQKISTLDRECILSLKAKLVEFEEETSIFKSKVNDIEKRMKFEVSKIENEILTPTININPNDDSQNYVNSKDVREYRIKGINEIASIKQKYYKDIRDLEIKFYKLEAEYEKDNEILREEYNLQIEALKYEIIKIENNIKTLLDEYDFNCYKTVNANELSYQIDKININRNFKQKTDDYLIKIKDNENKANKSWLSESVDVFNTIKSMDEKTGKSFFDYSLEHLKEVKTTSVIIVESMKKTIDIFMNMFSKIINTHIKTTTKLTNNLYESLLVTDYKSFNFKDFTFDSYKENINQLLIDYNAKRNSNLNIFMDLFKESISNLINQLKVISTNYDNYINEEINTINENNRQLDSLLTKAALAGIESANNFYKTKTSLTNSNYQNQNDKMMALETSLKNNELEVNNDFKNKEMELNKKINNNSIIFKQKSQKDLENYNQIIISINKSIKQAKVNFLNTVKIKKAEANNKYNKLVRDIKSDQKIKTKIGQI